MSDYDAVRAFFDGLAGSWDDEVDASRIKDLLLRAEVGPGQTVLDIGSGTGVLIPFILEAVGPEGRVYALDISPAMLERSKAKGFKGVHYICAPAEAIPLGDNTCDVVLCYRTFPHFLNKITATSEMSRVLAPGGRLMIAHPQSREELNELHRHMDGPVRGHHLPDDETMMRLMCSAGLTNTRISNGPSGYVLLAVKRELPTD